MSNPQEIYFHVGLGKVASTFLQQEFFPKLAGIYYLPTSKYRRSKRLIPRIKASRILVSREFDRQLEQEVRWFTETHPEAKVIILLRRHDEWIASQYRRHVKNGWFGSFEAFIDLDDDTGFWKQKDLFFYPMLEVISACTPHKPLVLFHEDLKRDPVSFLKAIASFTQSRFDPDRLSYKPVHTSFSDKQLKVLRAICRRYIKRVPVQYQDKLKHWALFRPVWAFYHLILYASTLLPDRWVASAPLIHPDSLRRVREFCQEDWDRVKRYANENNPGVD